MHVSCKTNIFIYSLETDSISRCAFGCAHTLCFCTFANVIRNKVAHVNFRFNCKPILCVDWTHRKHHHHQHLFDLRVHWQRFFKIALRVTSYTRFFFSIFSVLIESWFWARRSNFHWIYWIYIGSRIESNEKKKKQNVNLCDHAD